MATYAEPITERRVTTRRDDLILTHHRTLLVPIGRALFSAIFIVAGFGHFSAGSIGYATSQGLPLAGILVPLSGILAIIGGLSILIGLQDSGGVG